MMRTSNLHVFGTAALLLATACAVEVGDDAVDPGTDLVIINDDEGAGIDGERLVIDNSGVVTDAEAAGDDSELGTIGYVPPETTTTQMLANPGFEDLMFTYRDWQLRGSPTYVKQTTGASYKGTYGVRTESAEGSTGWVIQCMPAVVGRTYQVTAWTQRIAGYGLGKQWMHLVFWGGGTSFYSPGSPVVPSDSTAWNMLLLRRTAPAGADKLCVAVGATGWSGAPSRRRWDEVRLYRAD